MPWSVTALRRGRAVAVATPVHMGAGLQLESSGVQAELDGSYCSELRVSSICSGIQAAQPLTEGLHISQPVLTDGLQLGRSCEALALHGDWRARRPP